MDTVDKLLSELYVERDRLTLPTLPEVAVRVRNSLNDPNVTAGKVAKLINIDPALSARLLQIANSPLYRGKSHIDSTQTAVARLGNKVVRELVSGFAAQQLFNRADKNPALPLLKKVWNHSVHVAAISHVMTRRFTRLQPDHAMLAGLMHDIGSLPIIARAEKKPQLLEDTATLLQVATSLHTQLGKVILESWNFPDTLVAVAAEHEDLYRNSGETIDYVDIVMVANLHSYVGTGHNLGDMDWNRIPAFRKLGLGPDESLNMLKEAREEIRELQKLLTG